MSVACLGPFRRRKLIFWASAGALVEIVRPPIRQCGIWLGLNLFLVAFRRRFLDFTCIGFLPPFVTLSLSRTLCIKRPGLAICAVVVDIGDIDNDAFRVVVTYDVLPRFASFAKHGASVIILKTAYAFDGVILLFVDGKIAGFGGMWDFS